MKQSDFVMSSLPTLELTLKKLLSSNPGGAVEETKGHVMRYAAEEWNLQHWFSSNMKPWKMVIKKKSQLKLWIQVMDWNVLHGFHKELQQLMMLVLHLLLTN